MFSLDFDNNYPEFQRNLERLKQYRDTALIVVTLTSVLILLIRHTANNSDPQQKYPLLWLYTLSILSTAFRVYMYLVVKSFLEEFELE